MYYLINQDPESIIATAVMAMHKNPHRSKYRFFNNLMPDAELIERANATRNEINQPSVCLVGLPLMRLPADIQITNRVTQMIDYPIHNGMVYYDNDSVINMALMASNTDTKKTYFEKALSGLNDVSTRTPEQFFDRKKSDPFSVLYAFIEELYPYDMAYARVIDSLVMFNCDIASTVNFLEARLKMDSWQSRAKKISKRLTGFGDALSLVKQDSGRPYPKYAEALHCKCDYFMRLSHHTEKVHCVEILRNPWNKGARKIDSIPPPFVGSGINGDFKGFVLEENVNKLTEIIFNKLTGEGEMEKYGVDQEDPIENKAHDLLNKNKATDITDARAKALDQTKEGKADENIQRES